MGCSTNRTQCAPGSIFAANANPACGQFFNPSNFQAEQLIYEAAFTDMINNFGIPIDYYINTYSLSAADNLYGEHPTAIFYGPVSIMMYIELSENALNLSKFGFASDDELTAFVSIRSFEDAMTGKDFFIKTDSGALLSYEDYITYLQTQSAENIISNLLFNIATENSETGGFDLIGGDYEAINRYTRSGQAVEPKSGDLIML
jgi:hypothetical protein